MNIIFPQTLSIRYPYQKDIVHNTMIKRSAGRREYRGTYWSTPLWEITIPLHGITVEDMMTLTGFIARVKGALHSFYFRDAAPEIEGQQAVQGIYNPDIAIYDEAANIGNGVTTQFQLFRNWGWLHTEYPWFPPFPPTGYGVGGQQYDSAGSQVEGYGVPIWETPNIYFDGVLLHSESQEGSEYTIDQRGLVTFDPAPPANTVITVDFWFWYICRFKEDYARLKKSHPSYWDVEELTLVTLDQS